MYLCMYKTNKNEIQQAQLLEMCSHAGLRIGDGKDVDGIITQSYFF
jgi:hypothetical protein